MKIAIGSDHRGFEAKTRIVSALHQLGHEHQAGGTLSQLREVMNAPPWNACWKWRAWAAAARK